MSGIKFMGKDPSGLAKPINSDVKGNMITSINDTQEEIASWTDKEIEPGGYIDFTTTLPRLVGVGLRFDSPTEFTVVIKPLISLETIQKGTLYQSIGEDFTIMDTRGNPVDRLANEVILTMKHNRIRIKNYSNETRILRHFSITKRGE